MQTKTLISLTAFAALVLAGPVCRPADAAGAAPAERQAIQASYQRFTAAESSLNYASIKAASASFLAPDFMLHTATGHTLDRTKFLKEMELTTHEVVKVHKDTFLTASLKRHGATLQESGTYLFTRKALDVDAYWGKKNAPHQVSERMPYSAAWIMTAGGWRLQSLRLLSDRLIVDGKPQKLK